MHHTHFNVQYMFLNKVKFNLRIRITLSYHKSIDVNMKVCLFFKLRLIVNAVFSIHADEMFVGVFVGGPLWFDCGLLYKYFCHVVGYAYLQHRFERSFHRPDHPGVHWLLL